MIGIDLIAVPNQSVSVTIDEIFWELTIKTIGDMMCADVTRDGEVLVLGQRIVADGVLIPYRHLSLQGNFTVVTPNGEIPWWEEFGNNHHLMYLSPDEIFVQPEPPQGRKRRKVGS